MENNFHVSKRVSEVANPFRLLVESISDYAIFLVSNDYQILSWHAGSQALFGYSSVETLDQPLAELFASNEGYPKLFEQAHDRNGEVVAVQSRFRHKNGTIFPAQVTIRSTPDRNSYVTTIQPIEDANVSSLEKRHAALWETYFAGISDGVVIVGYDRSVIEANQRFADMLGYSLEEVKQLHVWDWDAIHNSKEIVETKFPETVEKTLIIETNFRRKDGSTFPVEITCHAIPWDNQSPPLCICRDISARKQAEQLRRREQEDLQRMFDVLPDGLFINNNDRITYCNPRFLELVGATSPDQVLGRSPLEFFHNEFQDIVRERIHQLMVECKPVPPLEEKLLRLDGSYVWVETTPSRTIFRSEPVIMVVLHDLTEQRKLELSQRENQARLRLMFEAIKEYAIYMMDKDGLVSDWNVSAQRMSGYSSEEIIGKHYSTFFTKKDIERKIPHKELEHTSKNSWVSSSGWRERKDGSRFWADGVLNALYDENGELKGYCKIARNSTERRTMEVLLRSVLDSALDGIIGINEKGVIEFYNTSAERMFGFTKEEAIGNNINILMPEPHHSNHDGYLQNYLQTGIAQVVGEVREVPAQRKDGSVFPLQITVTEFQSEMDGLRHFTGVVRDITEEKKLAAERDRLLEILHATPDFVGMADLQGNLIFLNNSARKFWGFSEEEDITTYNIKDFHPPETNNLLREIAFPRALEFGSWLGETVLRKHNGEKFPASQLILCHRHPDNSLYLSAVIRDLTQQKKMEEQLRESQKLEAIGRLAGGVAHDFNNLLTIIIGYTEMLLSNSDQRPQSEKSILESILNAGNRATRLTQQLLAFGRKQILSPKVIHPNHLIQELEPTLRLSLSGSNIKLVCHAPSDTWTVLLDPNQLESVINHLMNNARDAMPNGGTLGISIANVRLDGDRLTIRPDDEVDSKCYVQIAISDTGKGMSDETQSRLFEPFFTTKEFGHGFGLGLAVVDGIIRQSGGFMQVESKIDKGSIFKIYLPAYQTQDHEKQSQGRTPSKTMLLVETNEGVRRVTQLSLTRQGYEVLEASSGVEAIRTVSQSDAPIHLLITNTQLPTMSGQKLAEILRRNHPHLKTLYVTDHDGRSVDQQELDKEHARMIQKPYTPLIITRTVREILGEQE